MFLNQPTILFRRDWDHQNTFKELWIWRCFSINRRCYSEGTETTKTLWIWFGRKIGNHIDYQM